MRFDYINSFADSAQQVIAAVVPTEINRGSITLMDSISADGVSATIFLVGKVDGRIVLDLEPTTAKKIAGIMNDKEFIALDHLVIDTICELTNMIIGKAVTALNNRGFQFRPSPPCFFIGSKKISNIEALCIRLTTGWGDMRIQAAVTEKW